ncbi:MAG: nucleotide sugar dehydrogenase [Chloroflexota bacterium]
MVVQQRSAAATLEQKLLERTARVGIMGLGYAGLPMAVEIARAGFTVTGFDVSTDRVQTVNDGRSPVSDVDWRVIRDLVSDELLSATTDFAALAQMDAVIICVPTPLDDQKQPDLRYVRAATQSIAQHLHQGMMVVLQSTCSPGTTRDVLLPVLEQSGLASGLTVGKDYFLVFAPERIDPGNTRFNVQNTPKLVGGMTPTCTDLARHLYQAFIDDVHPVSSPEVAEMSKLVENTFRFINISFVNEIAMLCDKMGVSVWDVIDAAATKPFAFMPHFPGPGVGGHCIPIVPFYLEAVADRFGLPTELIKASGRINDYMPSFVIEKMDRLLQARGLDPKTASVLLIGITYKRDVADLRESSALEVMNRLLAQGRTVTYHDPMIESVQAGGGQVASVPLSAENLRNADCVVLLTPHTNIDFNLVIRHAPVIFDTCNALKKHRGAKIVAL